MLSIGVKWPRWYIPHLRDAAPIIKVPITFPVNISHIYEGILPEELNIVRAKPIFTKRGHRLPEAQKIIDQLVFHVLFPKSCKNL